MGKINKVLYKEIDENLCTVNKAAEFYYHSNLLGVNDIFQNEYEKYEESQIKLKNKLLGNAIKNKEIDDKPDVNSSMLAISSLKTKVIIISDLKR